MLEILEYKSNVPLTGNVLGRCFDDDAIYYLLSADRDLKTHDTRGNVQLAPQRCH